MIEFLLYFIRSFDDPSIAWAHFICMYNYWPRSCLMVRYAAHRLPAATAKGGSLSSVCPDSSRLCRYDVRRDKSVHKEIDSERFNQVQLPLARQQFSQIEKKYQRLRVTLNNSRFLQHKCSIYEK